MHQALPAGRCLEVLHVRNYAVQLVQILILSTSAQMEYLNTMVPPTTTTTCRITDMEQDHC